MNKRLLISTLGSLALASLAACDGESGDAPGLHAAVAALRGRGETVVCVLPGHENEIDEFDCDRELIEVGGQWVVQSN